VLEYLDLQDLVQKRKDGESKTMEKLVEVVEDVFVKGEMETDKMCVDVGLGLFVELKPDEARKFIKKRIENINMKLATRKEEVLRIEALKDQFLKQYEMLKNVESGMQNIGC
jgi:prefoldin alpha subunit